MLTTHIRRKVYVAKPDSQASGIVNFRGNQKGKINGVGKIGIPPYPSNDNVLFVEGLNTIC